jgi:hypothetical protein
VPNEKCTLAPPAPSAQVGGNHYQSLSPQPIEVIEAWGLEYHLACALKYIARAGRKEGVSSKQDLEKAVWYIKRWIETNDPDEGDGAVRG